MALINKSTIEHEGDYTLEDVFNYELISDVHTADRETHTFIGMSKDGKRKVDSIFKPETESANTKAIIASSYSGKTTFYVRELNALISNDSNHAEEYDNIVIFTESMSSEPLKHLNRKAFEKKLDPHRLQIFDRYLPMFVRDVALINNEVNNRFKYLFIFDDVLTLKGPDVEKMVLTLRNANISSVFVIQYFKLLSPAQRNSIHDYYFMRLAFPDWYFIVNEFIGDYIRKYLYKICGDEFAFDYNDKQIAFIMMYLCYDRIMHFSQRFKTIRIYLRPAPFKGGGG